MPSGGLGVSINGTTPRQYETGGQLTVADLLRREGMTPAKKLAAIESPVPGRRRETADFSGDSSPTVQLLVTDLLRREGELPEPERPGKRTKIGIGAGIAALFGLAAIGYGAIQLHGGDAITSATGLGERAIGPADTTALSIQPNLVASSAPTVAGNAPALAKAAGSAASASSAPRPTTESSARPASPTPQAAAPVTTSAAAAPTASSAAKPPVASPTPTTPVVAPPAKTTPTPTTDTGLLGTATGLLSGVITGVLG